jgi:hypothetical protein
VKACGRRAAGARRDFTPSARWNGLARLAQRGRWASQMRNFLLLAFLLPISACSSAEADFVPQIRNLMEICASHPELTVQSIDSFEPKQAKSYEKDFHETASTLHPNTKNVFEYLLRKKKTSSAKEIECIDKIMGTWP